MKKEFTAIRNKEEAILGALKQIVVITEDCVIESVPAVYGDSNLLEGFVLNIAQDEFFTHIADRIEEMRLPVIGVTTVEVGATHVKMKGLIYTAWREDLNQIIEQVVTTTTIDPRITVGPVRIGKRQINKCNILWGDFDIQFTE